MSSALTLAVTWDPFIRGIIVVLIGVGVLCGSVYLLLLTNLGARLGFLISVHTSGGHGGYTHLVLQPRELWCASSRSNIRPRGGPASNGSPSCFSARSP